MSNRAGAPKGAAITAQRELAEAAGLHHVSDEEPGFTRRRRGPPGFTFLRADGRPLRDRAARSRIVALAIPPAWTDVWISTDARGHIQATGRDERGRKQYRYHELWEEVRNVVKFGRLHPASARAAERQCVEAVDAVAERLRNTRAVARGSYIHPAVLAGRLERPLGRRFRVRGSTGARGTGLSIVEKRLLALLRHS